MTTNVRKSKTDNEPPATTSAAAPSTTGKPASLSRERERALRLALLRALAAALPLEHALAALVRLVAFLRVVVVINNATPEERIAGSGVIGHHASLHWNDPPEVRIAVDAMSVAVIGGAPSTVASTMDTGFGDDFLANGVSVTRQVLRELRGSLPKRGRAALPVKPLPGQQPEGLAAIVVGVLFAVPIGHRAHFCALLGTFFAALHDAVSVLGRAASGSERDARERETVETVRRALDDLSTPFDIVRGIDGWPPFDAIVGALFGVDRDGLATLVTANCVGELIEAGHGTVREAIGFVQAGGAR